MHTKIFLKTDLIFDKSMTLGNSELNIFEQKIKGVIMLYRIINSGKLKNFRTAFSILLIISFMSAFNGCYTTYEYIEDSKTFIPDSTAKITQIQLINGRIIECTDRILKFETGADSVKYLVLRSYVKGKDYNGYWSERRIPENQISVINLEKSELNINKTIIVCIGLVALVLVTVILFSGFHSGSMSLGEF